MSPDDPDAIRIVGTVFDGEGEPVVDAMIELWQANRAGRYAHPEDTREELPLEDGFEGFGRSGTDSEGGFEFTTVKPGPVPGPGGVPQAPHIDVSIFARGVLKRIATRIYFPDEADANAADPVLTSIEDPEERATLVAVEDDGGAALRHPAAGRPADRVPCGLAASSAGCSSRRRSARRPPTAPGSRRCSTSRPRWPLPRPRWA